MWKGGLMDGLLHADSGIKLKERVNVTQVISNKNGGVIISLTRDN